MKKRILAFTLSLVMLLSMVNLAVFADDSSTDDSSTTVVFAKPAGASSQTAEELTSANMVKVSTTAELEELTSNVISFGLPGSSYTGSMTLEKAEEGSELTAEQIAKNANIAGVSDHKTYGFSLIGASLMNQPASKATNKEWTNSNYSLNYIPTGLFYDVNGNSDTTNTNNNGCIYTALYTFNFGQTVNVDKIGFISASVNNMPQIADIYVSDDGENWRLVSYYDRIALRSANADFAGSYTNISNADGALAWGGQGTASNSGNYGTRFYVFDITNQTAQYVRIASTAYNGGTNNMWNSSTEKYNAGVGSYGIEQYVNIATNNDTKIVVGEMLVFGNKLVSVDAVQTTEVNTTASTYDARFVAKVDDSVIADTNAKCVTFKISAEYYTTDENNKTTVGTKTYSVDKVYSTIKANNEDVSAPTGFKYALVEITGIPSDVNVTFTIIPVIEYENGSTITGDTATCTLPAETETAEE